MIKDKDLKRELTRLTVCPLCNIHPLICDMKRLTIFCRSCGLDWILSYRINRHGVNNKLPLVDSRQTKKIINDLNNGIEMPNARGK